jgi:hypothetical protein
MYRSTFFFTSALDGGKWSASRPGHFTPGTHWIEGRVGPRILLDNVEKIVDPTGTRATTPQSLYRLRYPGSYNIYGKFTKIKR